LREKSRSLRKRRGESARRSRSGFREAEPRSLFNNATSKEDAEALAEQIRGNGRKAKAIPADISDPSQASAFVDAAVKEIGWLNILVNNAGGKRI
jgi:NAD(P)-dependent dehydrogenase (short-subunit alcohol dehydrogenase family)